MKYTRPILSKSIKSSTQFFLSRCGHTIKNHSSNKQCGKAVVDSSNFCYSFCFIDKPFLANQPIKREKSNVFKVEIPLDEAPLTSDIESEIKDLFVSINPEKLQINKTDTLYELREGEYDYEITDGVDSITLKIIITPTPIYVSLKTGTLFEGSVILGKKGNYFTSIHLHSAPSINNIRGRIHEIFDAKKEDLIITEEENWPYKNEVGVYNFQVKTPKAFANFKISILPNTSEYFSPLSIVAKTKQSNSKKFHLTCEPESIVNSPTILGSKQLTPILNKTFNFKIFKGDNDSPFLGVNIFVDTDLICNHLESKIISDPQILINSILDNFHFLFAKGRFPIYIYKGNKDKVYISEHSLEISLTGQKTFQNPDQILALGKLVGQLRNLVELFLDYKDVSARRGHFDYLIEDVQLAYQLAHNDQDLKQFFDDYEWLIPVESLLEPSEGYTSDQVLYYLWLVVVFPQSSSSFFLHDLKWIIDKYVLRVLRLN